MRFGGGAGILLALLGLMGACASGPSEAELREAQMQRELAALRQDIVAINLTLDANRSRAEANIRELGRRSEAEGQGRAALVAQLQELLSEVRLVQGRLEESARSTSETTRRVDRLEDALGRVAALNTQLVSLEGQLQAQQERVDHLSRGGTPPAGPGGPLRAPGGPAAGPAPQGRGESARVTGEAADSAYRAALTDFTKQNFEQAIRGFQAFLQSFPQDGRAPDAAYWLAESLRGQGNYAQAAKEFEAFVRSHPDSPKAATAQVRHGEALLLSGDKAGCAILERAQAQYPRARAGALAKDLLGQHCRPS